jgi:hypothetical protein
VRANAPLSDDMRHMRTKVEREREIAKKALDRHLIADLTNVVRGYLCVG